MDAAPSPAVVAFVAALGDGSDFVQLRINRFRQGFEIRHTEDADAPPDKLSAVKSEELRTIAMDTPEGAFRPLKSAPSLQAGWRCEVAGPAELETALGYLYPGGITDWHVRNDPGQATSYREFTARQTGMYRITAKLDAKTAPPVLAAGCDDRFCLKQRRWTYDGPANEPAGDLALPCLEPCPVLLEFARKAVRIHQEATAPVNLSLAELDSLLEALEAPPAGTVPREADFADVRNSRRRELLKHKLTTVREELREEPEQ